MSSTDLPLKGIRVLEMAAIGPVPFAGMMLADMGAEVIRLDRLARPEQLPGTTQGPDILGRGKQSLRIDLKHPDAADVVLRLVERADVLLEGLRPGVMERLGLGPDTCQARNPALVYGRMTGYGQTGPDALLAGHDINYIAVGGVLDRIGRKDQPPTPPLNVVGDFGGGAMFLVSGVLAGLLGRSHSGQGTVVDAAMSEGSMLLTAGMFAATAVTERGTNLLDSGAPFYDAYECADGLHLAVGPIEPQFWRSFVEVLGPPCTELDQLDRAQWPKAKDVIAERIRELSRDDWVERFRSVDTCVSPVLRHDEIASYPQHAAREAIVSIDGVVQPGPAPRFNGLPRVPAPPPELGIHTESVLSSSGFSSEEIDLLTTRAVVGGLAT